MISKLNQNKKGLALYNSKAVLIIMICLVFLTFWLHEINTGVLPAYLNFKNGKTYFCFVVDRSGLCETCCKSGCWSLTFLLN